MNASTAKCGRPLRYLVRIYRYRSSYSADVPDLPGCIAAARTLPACKRLIAGAIAMHLEGMREAGERIPQPKRRIQFEIDDSDDEAYCTWVEVPTRKPVRA